jgi:hypothetical protein
MNIRTVNKTDSCHGLPMSVSKCVISVMMPFNVSAQLLFIHVFNWSAFCGT